MVTLSCCCLPLLLLLFPFGYVSANTASVAVVRVDAADAVAAVATVGWQIVAAIERAHGGGAVGEGGREGAVNGGARPDVCHDDEVDGDDEERAVHVHGLYERVDTSGCDKMKIYVY